jgi:hypothetical protein
MAETKPLDEMSDSEILQQLEKAVNDTSKANAPALATFAKFQEQRASRLNTGLQRIKKDVGEKHPFYAAIKTAAETASTMNMQFKSHATRIQNRPVPKSYEWIVSGQVLDAGGKPAEALTVRVFDRDRKSDDFLGETETDANGEFSVTFHERDFKEAGEQLPELYVNVIDAKGTVLHTTRDNVRFRAGQAEYFLIRLGKPPAPAKTKTRTRSKKGS